MHSYSKSRKSFELIFLLFWLGQVFPGLGSSALRGQSNAHESPKMPANVVIHADKDWVPLNLELDIEAGSALDFSRMGFHWGPAGNMGRVIARPNGQFAFEKDPQTPRRFYGINLCMGAQYPLHTDSERLADRLARLGYNSVRLHHYERDLVSGQKLTTQLNPERIDQLDYLVAALAKRGIYITTDLYVSRPVPKKEIGLEGTGLVGMDHFKILVPVHPGAWENWKQFSRTLLNHVNPYTHHRYADDPSLALVSLINEGNFGNFFSDLRTVPEWQKAWNQWLSQRYPLRKILQDAWKGKLADAEDPARNSVEFPQNLFDAGPRERDCVLFLSETDREMTRRMTQFLREEIKTSVLITNTNSWTNHTTNQATRTLYDYVDDHFYVDHPEFLEKDWQLPSRCPNTSPIVDGAPGGRDRCFTRVFHKPFAITEYNYSGPGRFRGVGGILTGAMGALQGWAGIWRFAYSHSQKNLFSGAPLGYFDMVSDPLSQAAERASLCLFLRGDMKMAPHRVALTMTTADLDHPPSVVPQLAPRWHWIGWLTRLGTEVLPDSTGSTPPELSLPLNWAAPTTGDPSMRDPYQIDNAALLALLKEKRILTADNPTNPDQQFFRSETGEITIDGPRDQLTLDTARTCGGYAPAGQTIQDKAENVTISIIGTNATVWVSSLDGQAIPQSRHLILTHLTDLQNEGIQYAEVERKTLLGWGGLPHLVRNGQARIRLQLMHPENFEAWALSTGGRRLKRLPIKTDDRSLEMVADVGAFPKQGAQMIYELVHP
jgi:hypothetical protein